ncbi:MAG: hypothetical protein A3J82_06030 [Elusimicrobia bacterium RIFOXYA2_FULL_69_6]|nr:MAG: hypothetical protein A3J82_06030 [Elusimicrobia bacterium RIFOXYA2_FULL_69_6]
MKSLIELHIQGRLLERQSRWVDAHLSRCPRCRAEAAAWERLFTGLRGLPARPAPAGLKESLRRAAARPAPAEPAEEAWDLRPILPPALALAGSFAALLLSVSASILGPGLPSQGCSDAPQSVCVPRTSNSVAPRLP